MNQLLKRDIIETLAAGLDIEIYKKNYPPCLDKYMNRIDNIISLRPEIVIVALTLC